MSSIERPLSVKDSTRNHPAGWALWRQDDNGHRFLICVRGSKEEAEGLRASYESLGHKQYYFVEPFPQPGPGDPA
jgi:hypothetical protein